MHTITLEVARMILAFNLANESDEHKEMKGMITRSQCDIMDTAPSFCSDIGIDFDAIAEKIAIENNLEQYTDLVLPAIEAYYKKNNNEVDGFDDDDIASEIFHQLLGTGGGSGDELDDLVSKIIPCYVCECVGLDEAYEIIDTFLNKQE